MSLLEDIGIFLITHTQVTADGIDFFRDAIPEAPDSLVAASEYAGAPQQLGVESANRSVQIAVRESTYAAASAKAWIVYKLLVDPIEPFIDLVSGRWCLITARQTPFKMQIDTQGRTIFAFNLIITTKLD